MCQQKLINEFLPMHFIEGWDNLSDEERAESSIPAMDRGTSSLACWGSTISEKDFRDLVQLTVSNECRSMLRLIVTR